jgi:hypothetical protein
MSDAISNPAAQWRPLCEAAVLELDAEKLSARIAEARIAVFSRLKDRFQNLSEGEQLALQDALDMLHVLSDIATREIVEQKTGT